MKKYEKVFFVSGLFLCTSELFKQLILTFSVNDGVYDWWHFPFQLCSLPMYLLVILPFLKSEGAKHTVLTFLMTFSLLGGIAVFFDTSGMKYPLTILTVHSFAWHILLIAIGISSGILLIRLSPAASESPRLPWRTFLHASLMYLSFCLTAVVINLMIAPSGRINMFYINPVYPMEQVLFTRISLTLGNSAGIAVYILATITGSAILYALWRILGRKLSRLYH